MMKSNDDNEKSKEEKNTSAPSNSQHSTNPSLFANVKIVNEATSQGKNEKIDDQKISNERDKNMLRALTSPGGRSPEVSSIPMCKTAAKSKSESHVSRSDVVTVTIKSTISSFKPLKLVMKKTTSIRVLKNYLQSRLGGAHQIILIHDNKELKNEGGTLASFGITSGSVLWLLVKPMAGNNDREEIASLIRISQSLANLRNLIRSLPSVDSCEPTFSGSAEYIEVTPCKEAEHEQMREKMKLLIQRREKFRRNNVKDLSGNVQQEIQGISAKEGTADVVNQKELATYFDPPETIKQRKFEDEELFDVPSNESELLKIKDEIKNKRCGLCRIKLQITDREMQCTCGHVFCSKHRNPQIHRCSIDLKSVDREHVRTALPKLVRDIPKSKI
ncbi:AN1-like Zinc finger family protein [Brugia pahangi]